MPDYLIQESGGRLLLENGSGALLLEYQSPVPPSPPPPIPAPVSPYGTGGGGGGPFYDPHRKTKHFQELEQQDALTDDEELELLLVYIMRHNW